ncbi:MAG TPA: helical backbone metal receptor [Flavisolibacter sp.]|nr:helical backbone metal receptor [Flavisolibacter sp.]
MLFFTDQLQREIAIAAVPKRIVSLVPSQTELLYDLGLENEVIGITKFCVHPSHWFRNKQRIGGTKNVAIEKVLSLQPDLVIANKEENVKEQIDLLAAQVPVWISDINNLQQALEMTTAVGDLTGKIEEAKQITQKIEAGFVQLQQHQKKLRTAYLIWKDPYMTVGNDTFIHDMLSRNGFENVFGQQQRYPVITMNDLKEQNCQMLLLSSEPYPFQQKHLTELQQQLPETKIILADGEMFSWYGSRLIQSAGYFQSLQKQIEAMV